MTVDEILQRLDGVKREREGQWAARCPAHSDGKPSLAVKAGDDGKVLLYCAAGCELHDILRALQLEAKDLFAERDAKPEKIQVAAAYPYHDERGELVYEVVRLVPKSFRQRRPFRGEWIWALGEKSAADLRKLGFAEDEGIAAVRRVLYRLPELLADTTGRRVFVVEGEKDVDTLRALGFLATCCAGGSNAWHHVAAHAAEVLKGRHVTILPDNDEPGRKYAAAVATSLRGAAASIRMLQLPGLADHGDVSDWVRDGGTAAALIELVRSAPAPDEPMPELAGIDIGTLGQRLEGERQKRLEDAQKIIPFGVSFLDDSLGGMLANDLIVLTARPGAGKTQLASAIAERAAENGRRVLGLFLEADRGEIERRIKFRVMAQGYADGAARRAAEREQHHVISYGGWVRGELEQVLGPGDDVGRALSKRLGDRLRTVYRGSSFTLEDTERVMVAMQDHVDLFVVDHLHYVDVEDEVNELRAVTAIMTKLRDLALRLHKPVLLVAHLRKEDRHRSLVPSLADLHGSSNVVRIATRVIALAPAPRVKANSWHLAPTFMAVLKDRIDGATPLVAKVVFDRSLGLYREAYELGVITHEGPHEEWTRIEDRPWWAKRAAS